MAKRTSKQRVLDKAEGATVGSIAGASIAATISAGNPVAIGVGAAIGAAGGLYYAHNGFVFPENVIVIPARQEYLLSGTPDFKVVGLMGESIKGTGIMDDIYREAVVEATVDTPTATKRKPTKYNRAYAKAFKSVAHKYKLKTGSWAKNGFARAQKEAHSIAGGK